jgi:hypothetical protein
LHVNDVNDVLKAASCVQAAYAHEAHLRVDDLTVDLALLPQRLGLRLQATEDGLPRRVAFRDAAALGELVDGVPCRDARGASGGLGAHERTCHARTSARLRERRVERRELPAPHRVPVSAVSVPEHAGWRCVTCCAQLSHLEGDLYI